MNTLLFIRHAETDMAGRFCGHSDPPVNESGRRQIEALLEALEGKPIDAIYTSDLSRALTTAGAIAERFQLSSISVPALREISFGEWEGLSWHEIESRDAVYAQKWSESYPHLPAPGGEPFEEFQSRVIKDVEYLLALPYRNHLAIVTHAGVMRVVLQTLCGLDEKTAWERTRSYCCFFEYKQKESSV